jgi:hypothetical protein
VLRPIATRLRTRNRGGTTRISAFGGAMLSLASKVCFSVFNVTKFSIYVLFVHNFRSLSFISRKCIAF